ncbi:MAG: hypothetical protein LBV71_13865 [Prevotella sp.]|jgi:hypothetical protein|nr:hypothetical protein [Prevotella sp.]
MTAEEKAYLLKWNIEIENAPFEDAHFIEIMKKYKGLKDDDIDILFRYGYNIISGVFKNCISLSKDGIYHKCKEYYSLLRYLDENPKTNIKFTPFNSSREEKLFPYNTMINETLYDGIKLILENEIIRFFMIGFSESYVKKLYSKEKYSSIPDIQYLKEKYPKQDDFVIKFREDIEYLSSDLEFVKSMLQVLELDIDDLEREPKMSNRFADTYNVIYTLIDPQKASRICHLQIQEIALFLMIDEFLSSDVQSIQEITLQDWQCKVIFEVLSFFKLYSFSKNNIAKSVRRRFNHFKELKNMEKEQAIIEEKIITVDSYIIKKRFSKK